MDDWGLRPAHFLDLDKSIASGIFSGLDFPWQAIPLIAAFILDALADPPAGFHVLAPGILVAEGVSISPRAELLGPAIIGAGSEIRAGAMLRENVVIGKACLVGNSSELKNCLLFDGALVPHFNYVGDSILGAASHLGVGAILSNFKSDHSEVSLRLPDGRIMPTGLLKFGAIVGDGCEIGCNCVCFPGTLVGRGTTIYPLCPVRGLVPAGVIVKAEGLMVPRITARSGE